MSQRTYSELPCHLYKNSAENSLALSSEEMHLLFHEYHTALISVSSWNQIGKPLIFFQKKVLTLLFKNVLEPACHKIKQKQKPWNIFDEVLLNL